jgi:quercetin dioxygenase-like cupin family protein
MKRYLTLVITLAMGVAIGLLGVHLSSAQEALAKGTILQRADVAGSKGMEAILVLRELPPGAESGKHTQSGTEIVYILEGSAVFEAAGQPPKTLSAGQAFSTAAGEVHNVKNASSSAPAKALAFYIAKKGAKLDELSKPAK